MSYLQFEVKVNVKNPGQFLSCVGLLELADRIWKGAEGSFNEDTFIIKIERCKNDPNDDPLSIILKKLCEIGNDKIKEDKSRGDKKTHPLVIENFKIVLDWWIDERGESTEFKLWAGNQSPLQIVRKLCEALHPKNKKNKEFEFNNNIFNIPVQLSGRFGFDPRSAWKAIDVGFSPNDQGMDVATYPAVELLAAIGLARFRPIRNNRGLFQYATWHTPIPVSLVYPAGAHMLPPMKGEIYEFNIVERGSYKGFDWARRSRD